MDALKALCLVSNQIQEYDMLMLEKSNAAEIDLNKIGSPLWITNKRSEWDSIMSDDDLLQGFWSDIQKILRSCVFLYDVANLGSMDKNTKAFKASFGTYESIIKTYLNHRDAELAKEFAVRVIALCSKALEDRSEGFAPACFSQIRTEVTKWL